MAPPSKQNQSSIDGRDFWNGKEGSYNSKLASERSLTLKRAIHHFNPIQMWDWLFKSCEVNGRVLLHDGLIDIKDIEKCILKGDCKKLGIKLPAWSILQCLLTLAKSDLVGLIISDEVELTKANWPRGKVFECCVRTRPTPTTYFDRSRRQADLIKEPQDARHEAMEATRRTEEANARAEEANRKCQDKLCKTSRSSNLFSITNLEVSLNNW